nr:hypothetical protein [uncultured archaeon]
MKKIQYQALRCNCGDTGCSDWHVSGVADVHGVSFTRAQAEAVAALLNEMESCPLDGG